MQEMTMKDGLPSAVVHFNSLPPEARINSKALKILLGINSPATFSRRRKDGSIPDPDCPHNTWSVRKVRDLLNSGSCDQSQVVQ